MGINLSLLPLTYKHSILFLSWWKRCPYSQIKLITSLLNFPTPSSLKIRSCYYSLRSLFLPLSPFSHCSSYADLLAISWSMKHASTSGPLQFLFSWLGTLNPECPHGSLHHFFLGFTQMFFIREVFYNHGWFHHLCSYQGLYCVSPLLFCIFT